MTGQEVVAIFRKTKILYKFKKMEISLTKDILYDEKCFELLKLRDIQIPTWKAQCLCVI